MKRNHILILIALSLIPLVFSTIIPFASAKRLNLNILSSEGNHVYDHESQLYVSSFQEGNQYTINVFISSFWDTDVLIKISDTPYILAGKMVDTITNTDEIMHFNASRTGDHYIQITSKSGSGFFDIRIDEGITNSATGPLRDFFGSTYLLVLILPSTIILLIGVVISLFLKKQNKKKKDNLYPWRKKSSENLYRKKETNVYRKKEKEEEYFCTFCGSKIEKSQQTCSNCGTTQE